MSRYSSAATWSVITHLGVVGSMLLRNIIFARCLNPTDFAIALTFGLVFSLFEYISNFGHENLMQRSNKGNEPSFQATMHSAMIMRGTAVATLIIVISPFIPSALNLGDVKFNYALLAIIPFITGFAHLDHQRFHRRQIYIISAKIGLTADTLSVIVALICVSIWDNYLAFYVSLLIRLSTSTVLSHIWARRPYQLAFNKQHIKSLINFGLPLLMVGVLKYVGMETDKAIVARYVGLETFAVYVLTLMVVVNGTNIVTVALSKIFIRRISIAKELIVETIKSNGIIYCYLFIPILIVLGILGEDIILLIFGKQYAKVPFLIFAVCTVVGLRSLNQWLNQIVIACTSTKLMLIADIVRVLSALIGVWLVYSSHDVIKIAMAFWFAETLYFIALTILLQKRFPVAMISVSVFSIYLLCMIILFGVYIASYQHTQLVKVSFTLTSLFLFYSVFLTLSATCRTQSLDLLRPTWKRLGF